MNQKHRTMKTEQEIKEEAIKFANRCEFKSNFPHDWASVNEGFIEGAKWILNTDK